MTSLKALLLNVLMKMLMEILMINFTKTSTIPSSYFNPLKYLQHLFIF